MVVQCQLEYFFNSSCWNKGMRCASLESWTLFLNKIEKLIFMSVWFHISPKTHLKKQQTGLYSDG